MKYDKLWWLAQHDLENCHVEDDFDEDDLPNLTEKYSQNQRRNPDEAQYR